MDTGACHPSEEVEPDRGPPFWRTPQWWRRIARVTAAVWISTVLAFAATVVAARALGPSDYGAVVLAVSVAGLIATFLDLTLEEAVVHHGARALAEGDHGKVRGLLRTALVVDVAIGLFVSAVMFVFAEPLADLLGRGRLDPTLLRLAALSTVAGTADGTTGAVLLIARRTDLRAWSLAGTSLARLAFVALAVAVGGSRAVLVAYAAASALGSAVQAFLGWRVGWRSWARAPATTRGLAWVRTLFAFGVHTSVATSVIAVNRGVVSVFLGRFAGTSAVGLFDAGMLPVSITSVVSNPIRLWLLPEQAWLSARGRIQQLRRMIRDYTMAGLALGTVGAVIGWFLLPTLIPALYSEEFSGAVGPARILLVAAVVSLATGWTKTLAGAVGRPQIRTAISALQLVLLLVFLSILVGRHGITGAAVVVSATSILIAGMWWAALRVLLPASAERPHRPLGHSAGDANPSGPA